MIVGCVLKTSWLSMCVSDPCLKAMVSNQLQNYISQHAPSGRAGSCSFAFTGGEDTAALEQCLNGKDMTGPPSAFCNFLGVQGSKMRVLKTLSIRYKSIPPDLQVLETSLSVQNYRFLGKLGDEQYAPTKGMTCRSWSPCSGKAGAVRFYPTFLES